ncbi:GntR family transcriptional regulator [Jannaschia pohangensis]|uniref:Transcriptional regulator, GntR family n=1 Tax=Jannaschia pohangensis TaxID=390807 RepID=A0A1I3HCA8_9RHOB|nr:GntR family transcriptional regulator [Jannaschia pohangensis]SFI33418.1 transcriptional regulator, GntR family [Jannaschia pohangensis]
MATITRPRDRRTSVDVVFDHLHEAIVSLELLPGDKISEADIATRFGVSRQPVRDAFSRLANLDLLLIRPQKATEVKRFSVRETTKSRFIRSCVEAEVLRRAARTATPADHALLDAALAQQAMAVADGDYEVFGQLDYAFHKALCKVARVDWAFEIIAVQKASVDRLCRLSIAKEDRMGQLLDDHTAICSSLKNGDAERAVEAGMIHLSRLDATIDAILDRNPDYFDD